MHAGRRYLVYEYLEEGSLREYMHAPDFVLGEGLGLLLRAAQGVAAAHRKGIVHRRVRRNRRGLLRARPVSSHTGPGGRSLLGRDSHHELSFAGGMRSTLRSSQSRCVDRLQPGRRTGGLRQHYGDVDRTRPLRIILLRR